VCTTSPFFACTSPTGTFQRAAAAASSIWRAAAPHRRIGMKKWRVLREPSVSWLPYRVSSPGACTTRTRDQSASSSSATIIGIPVRTPWPISERWQTMLTMPSSPIATNTSGLSTQPCGMPSAPYLGGSAARNDAGNPTASTRPPSAEAPWMNFRRLTLAIINGVSVDAASAAITLVESKRAFMLSLLSHRPPV
jgi:hypothetical protein